MINLNDLTVFVKVVECGSFSQAAKTLGKPLATVSRKVASLEEALGIRLLQRTTRKLSLTEEGRKYYLKCHSALNDIEHANKTVLANQQAPAGTLRITAPLSSQSGYTNQLICEFLRQYPEVNINMHLSDEVINIIDEGFDIAFRAGDLKDSSLVARKLGNSHLVLCAGTAYLEQSSPPKSLNDLKTHACIVYGNVLHNVNWSLQCNDQTTRVQINGRLAVNSVEFALQTCLNNRGIALLPYPTVAKHLASNKLQLVLPQYSMPVGGVYVVYPSKTHLSLLVRTFIDFVFANKNSDAPWFE